MDIGIVASRYAKALLRFSSENKEEAEVYAEMQRLALSLRRIKEFGAALHNPTLDSKQKVALLCAAACTEEKEQGATSSIANFFAFVIKKKRADLMLFIAMSYIHLYEREKQLTVAQLTVATPIEEKIIVRVRSLIQSRTKGEVQMALKIDPSLEAGFILEYDDYRMDASLRGQFERLHRTLKK